MTLPRHASGRLDRRYTVTREHCGNAWPMWVARFCGEWIGCARSKADAEELLIDHADARLRQLNQESQS